MSVQNGKQTYRVTTLGCRVNHAETRDLEAVLRSRGLCPAPEGDVADIEVVHTCSVTHAAVRKSRQAVRRARKGSQGLSQPLVLVTGCATGTDHDTFVRLAANQPQNVIPQTTPDGSSMVDRFARRLGDLLSPETATVGCESVRNVHESSSPDSTFDRRFSLKTLASVEHFPPSRHVRAEVKIQDGCDAHCTFCVIPRIRSTLRSKHVREVVREVRKLVDAGHREVVLSGIFLGAYGHETALRHRQEDSSGEYLAELLDAVADVPGLERVRLSSLEPGDVTDALLQVMRTRSSVVVPHLHLPLQSGSNEVLRRMNRQYTAEQYREMIDRVHVLLRSPQDIPPALTTDILVGFPGETEADFEATIEMVHHAAFLHMHVFPFSARSGTAAARWTKQFVPEEVKRERVKSLIALENDPETGTSIRYRRRLLGQIVRVLIEREVSDSPGWRVGRCDQYVEIQVQTNQPRGSIVHAVVSHVDASRTIANVTRDAISLPILEYTTTCI